MLVNILKYILVYSVEEIRKELLYGNEDFFYICVCDPIPSDNICRVSAPPARSDVL